MNLGFRGAESTGVCWAGCWAGVAEREGHRFTEVPSSCVYLSTNDGHVGTPRGLEKMHLRAHMWLGIARVPSSQNENFIIYGHFR